MQIPLQNHTFGSFFPVSTGPTFSKCASAALSCCCTSDISWTLKKSNNPSSPKFGKLNPKPLIEESWKQMSVNDPSTKNMFLLPYALQQKVSDGGSS